MAATDFENIGGPWTAENEPWRLRRAAKRPATRPEPIQSDGAPCRIQQLINSRMSVGKRTAGSKSKFVPHVHLDIYQKDYERVYGAEKAKEIVEANQAALNASVQPPRAPPTWKPSESNYNHPSIQRLQEEYYSKQIRPPIDVRLKAHKEAGYPQSYLLEMLKKHEEAVQAQPEVDAWFDLVMGPYGKKKETVPKPRTLTQIFKIKPIKVIMPDAEDIVAEEEDDE
jgi:hypothetical protein